MKKDGTYTKCHPNLTKLLVYYVVGHLSVLHEPQDIVTRQFEHISQPSQVTQHSGGFEKLVSSELPFAELSGGTVSTTPTISIFNPAKDVLTCGELNEA